MVVCAIVRLIPCFVTYAQIVLGYLRSRVSAAVLRRCHAAVVDGLLSESNARVNRGQTGFAVPCGIGDATNPVDRFASDGAVW